MDTSRKVSELIAMGFNCAQAVFATYAEEFGIDTETALRISCGLGGGMGGTGETCGAVSAAYLLLGLKYGYTDPQDKDAKEKTYAVIREFGQRFVSRHKTTICRELLGIKQQDNLSEQAIKQLKRDCPRFITDAAEIVSEMIH